MLGLFVSAQWLLGDLCGSVQTFITSLADPHDGSTERYRYWVEFTLILHWIGVRGWKRWKRRGPNVTAAPSLRQNYPSPRVVAVFVHNAPWAVLSPVCLHVFLYYCLFFPFFFIEGYFWGSSFKSNLSPRLIQFSFLKSRYCKNAHAKKLHWSGCLAVVELSRFL